jgi:LuxR family quorum-sensing system transcriptional regulator CciR
MLNAMLETAPSPATRTPPLTPRQLECLAWISQGKSSTDIGEILSISGRTVDYHVGEICQRLEVRTRMQAVTQAVQRGWLETA